MVGNSYRIKIVKGDFQFEAEGDKGFVQDMLKRFVSDIPGLGMKSANEQGKAGKGERAKIEPAGKPLSISEFIRQLGIKRHTEIVLAFGYYLEKYSGLFEFTPADINSCYYDAKMESSNTSQMITQNIKSSRIMEAKKKEGRVKGKKSYVLTRAGEDFIENKLANLEK